MEGNQQNKFAFVDTTATRKIFELRQRIRAVAGGTSASKTISILVWLIDYCQSSKNTGKLCTVVSESYPHLSGGAMLDFQNIMKDRGYWNESHWVKSPTPTYSFGQGNKIEFRSVDTYGKAHGLRRDVLFINECNNLAYNIVDQLIVRTREIIWLDWNPVSEFWFYYEMLPNRKDIDFITLTYLDNEALDQVTVKEIESHKYKKNWWKVYGEGQLGEAEGRIYKDWAIIDEIPHNARLLRYGLDFGYSADPTACVAIYEYDGGYILDEILYQKGMSNREIAEVMKTQSIAMIIADSAEPKSIDEIHGYGLNIVGSQKGKDSVNQGIQYVQDQRISVTKRSVNIIREYRNYLWEQNDDGEMMNVAQDFLNHQMDAIRYGMDAFRKSKIHIPKSFGGVKPYYENII